MYKYNTALRLVFAVVLAFGLVKASSAASCSLTGEVEVGGMAATSCGWGPTGDSIANTPTNTPQLPDDYLNWDVNDLAHNVALAGFWQYYYKQDLNSEDPPGGTTTPDISAGADGINLQITSTGGNDAWDSGTFSFNAFDPFLVVLGDGSDTEYHWYLFEGKTGPQTGTWDTSVIFGGKDLSNITIYANDESFPPVPVPAAVWLFGSGLIGLVGIARRRRT